MKTNDIGISEQDRLKVSEILGHVLADSYILYTKTRNYHWNVTGPHFSEYHKMFEEQYSKLEETIDDVAERIRALGNKVSATTSEFVKVSQINEHPGKYPDAKSMISGLCEDHETIIRSLREKIDLVGEKYHDAGTEDFLTGLLEEHEKTAWMLRSFLES
jgi:starvation-inducible DNA-binding protein